MRDATIITLPGLGEMTLRQALDAGFLSSGSNSQQGKKAEEQRSEQPHPDLDVQAFTDQRVEEQFTAMIETTSPGAQLQAVDQIISKGEIDQRTLGNLASQLGIEPDKALEQLEPIMVHFKAQGLAVMGKGGIDADAVVSYAQEMRPAELNAAMRRHATLRSTSGYAELREQYLSDLGEYDPETALAANLGEGWSSFRNDKGKVLVRTPSGATMSWASAMGLRRK